MVWLVKRISLIGALILSMVLPSLAQGSFSIAYRVNESVISNFDIDQRVKLMRFLGATDQNQRQAATEALIEDRLKAEAAQAYGVTVDDSALAQTIESFAQQRNLTSRSLMANLRRAGVARTSFEEFMAVSIVWRTLLRARYGQQAAPSEIDLNAQLNTYAVSSTSTIQIGEIILPYLGRGQDATVALASQLIAELRNGTSFSKLAQEYSRAPSAANGGVVGWVARNRLPAQIGAAIRGLRRGQVSESIFIPSGVVLIMVLDERTVSRQIEIPVNVNVTYAELVIPFGEGGNAEASRQADRLRRSLDGCRGLSGRAADFASGSGVFGPVSLKNIDTAVGLGLARLDPRQSTVVSADNALRVLVLCDRVSEMSVEGRARLRDQLFTQNLGALSAGFLLELRRNSVIERK
ncbi:MAG: peptidylprolyl isomerase [Rhodobacteraceae bacterium]|nr:peptidylprolyl isomerase [Paracoccaceae bacterium]